MTPDIKIAMDLIVDKEKRKFIGIGPTNVYVFARACVSSAESYRGSDCVRKCAVSAKCQNPELITSRMIRKYISTVSQVMSLTPNDGLQSILDIRLEVVLSNACFNHRIR